MVSRKVFTKIVFALLQIPSSDNRQIYYSNVFQCESTHQMAWTVSTYSYKGLLLVFGLFLAWETRNVNFRPLNDSRYIGMSVYNVVLWACISVPLNIWVTKRSVNADFGLFATAMNICVSSTLVLVFGPKVFSCLSLINLYHIIIYEILHSSHFRKHISGTSLIVSSRSCYLARSHLSPSNGEWYVRARFLGRDMGTRQITAARED